MTNFFKTSPRGEADRARTNQLLPPNDIDRDFNFSITKTEWEDDRVLMPLRRRYVR